MTGIENRGFWPNGEKPSDIATKACNNLFSKMPINKEKIDLLIHSSVCRDFLEPSTASIIQRKLNLSSHCQSFDLSNACLGFMNAISIAATMIDSKQIRYALVVSGENSGPLLSETISFLLNNNKLNRKDIKKYIANLTIGSAGVAFLLGSTNENPNKHEIIGYTHSSNSNANHLCQGNGNTHSLMMETSSEELLLKGIDLASKNWDQYKKEIPTKSGSWFISHQVGSSHETLLKNKLNLQDYNTFNTYKNLGNTGSAALPITFSMLKKENQSPKKMSSFIFLELEVDLTVL